MKTNLKTGDIVIFNTFCNTKSGKKIHRGDKGRIYSIALKNGIPAIELQEYPGAIFNPNIFV